MIWPSRLIACVSSAPCVNFAATDSFLSSRSTMPEAIPTTSETTTLDTRFEQSATLVLSSLQHALTDLFAVSPSPIRKAGDVERAFGINHRLGWQLYRIAHASPPLAAGLHVPARVSMKKLLTAAAKRHAPGEVLARVSEAFDAFERLIELEARDRDELDGMLAAFVPEEQRKQELLTREGIFKLTSQVRGIAAETDVAAMFFHPSADGQWVDRVSLNCELGLRRVRPQAHIIIGSGDSSNLATPLRRLDGQPCNGPWGALLNQFSTSPPPPVELHELGGMHIYRVAGVDVGLRSAIDLVIADRRDGALPRYFVEGRPRRGGPSYAVEHPVRRGTLDVFVHREVFPGSAPALSVYDTSVRGPVSMFDDPARTFDRVNTHETVRALPAGIIGARLPHVPRYTEMLEHVYQSTGWDPAAFRGYRLDVHFPLPGMVFMLGFELPVRPGLPSSQP